MKISVILPVYNGQEYLNECIESVLKQSVTDFELIIVDDCSRDRTVEICQEYARKDKRVRIFHQQNAGVTVARMRGLIEARGNYVAFIDADDWWDEDFLSLFMKEIEEYEYDLIVSGCVQEYCDRKIYKKNNVAIGKYIGDEEVQLVYSQMLYFGGFFQFGILPYMWNKLFKAELLKAVYSKIDIRIRDGEDVACLMPYLAEVKSLSIIEGYQYHYRMHSKQITAKKGNDFYENVSRLYLNLNENMKDKSCYDVFLPQLNQYMRYMIWLGGSQYFPKSKQYLFPYEKVVPKSKIILYAAGVVGKQYFEQLSQNEYCEVIAWVDKEKVGKIEQGFLIEAPEVIFKKESTYIVIALENDSVKEEVVNWLLGSGIKEEYLVW